MPEEKISEASQEERIPADAGTHAKGGETVAEAEPIADVPNRLEEPGREAFSEELSEWAAYEEKEYTDEEFSEMRKLYDETMRSVVEGEIVLGKILGIT